MVQRTIKKEKCRCVYNRVENLNIKNNINTNRNIVCTPYINKMSHWKNT